MPPPEVAGAERHVLDLVSAKSSELEALCRDVSVLVHLAGEPRPTATWEGLLGSNISSPFHLFTAAVSSGVRRIVFASSAHVILGHELKHSIRPSIPTMPDCLYGVSKCFGESLGAYLAQAHGIDFIALRIGAVRETLRSPMAAHGNLGAETVARLLVSMDEVCDLIARCAQDVGGGFQIRQMQSGTPYPVMLDWDLS